MSEPVLPHAAQTLDVDMKSLLAGLTSALNGARLHCASALERAVGPHAITSLATLPLATVCSIVLLFQTIPSWAFSKSG